MSRSSVRSSKWRLYLAACCALSCYLPLNSFSFAANLVESVSVPAKVMRFPGISVDGIHYDALEFAYAVEGELQVIAALPMTEALSCGGANKQSAYLQVQYQGPKIVFQITDTQSARVLLRQDMNTSGETAFAKGSCQTADEVSTRFEKQKQAWRSTAYSKVVDNAVQQMRSYMEEDAALQIDSLNLTLFRLVNQKRFNEANEAFDLASSGLAEYEQFGPTVDGEASLQQAVLKWETMAMKVADESSKKPELAEVRQALHRNLSAAYLILGNFDASRKHDALAVHVGMAKSNSIQDTILLYERRRILSPKVSKDMVLTANLFRFGRNAVANAELIQADKIASLDKSYGR